ncbi:pentapeptide repeat-containing protein [bacterium]|nr:pentapeptide repeat-containing protein [bacterium]
MARAKAKTAAGGKLAGRMVAFVGKFGYGDHQRKQIEAVAVGEGGTVVDGETTEPNILVEGSGAGGKPPAAGARIQKKYPNVRVVDDTGFYRMVAPTPEEFVALLKSRTRGHEFWSGVRDRLSRGGITVDLTGTDFRKLRLAEVSLYQVTLDDCDFRGATLDHVYFPKVTGAKFDGATMDDGSFSQARDCSLRNVTMNDTRWNPAEFVRCDFTGATLAIRTGSYTTATACTFRKADLREADLDESRFQNNDFRGANLGKARLEKSDFTGADLSGADLSGADLRNVKFVNANLGKAKFRGAILSGADLTGATVDGADFTGANLTGVNVAGLDTSKAKNLRQVAARTAGPHMRDLAAVAKQSKRLTTTIELALGPDEYVVLSPSYAHYGRTGYAGAGYSHQAPRNSLGSSVDAPSFEQGMLNLVDLWSRGTPRFDTIKVEAKKCPMKGKELHDLAVAAWYEALGLPVPPAADLQKQQAQAATDAAALREAMLAELAGGAAGVKKWNARSDKERRKVGKLRRMDFGGAKLSGAALDHLDLQGAKFDGASLSKVSLWSSQLQGATFANADLKGAGLAGTKCSDASFEGAELGKCNLRAANFLRTNFRGADLTAADFSFSDLRGADLTGAVLNGVTFTRTKFDEKTAFPPGFVPPEGLTWKGVGPRPGTPPPPPAAKPGSLDFPTFVQNLGNKVEAARMQKATAMLKAERFQLFADVTDDSVVGVVKSQTAKDLVYSCRLAADGAFACCTQNLRPCGGLRGGLCKHLLVMILGLAKAESLDPATADGWVDASKAKKPAIDEDVMSEAFLRYKGAEAGEVDWRPTETIPEDFYAV